MIKRILKLLFGRRTTVIILLLLQITITIFLLQATGKYRFISLTLTILSIIVVFYIINRQDKLDYKVTWIITILTFPLFGGFLYLIFRIQSSFERIQRKYLKYNPQAHSILIQDNKILENLKNLNEGLETQAKYLCNRIGFPVYQNSRIEYISSGESYFNILQTELKKAKKYIFLEYFIIEHGNMWDTILDILVKKAAEGVDVRLIYDDMGCMFTLPPKYYKKLENLGIKCIAFNPFRPFWTSLQNNRDHRKIVVVDGITAFTGGINLADEYINQKERFGHWKDSAVVIYGEAAFSFCVIFLNMWYSISKSNENFSNFLYDKTIIGNNLGYVQPYCDTPVDNENIGEHIYLQIINNARSYMYISTPYLIIDENLNTALCLAAKSGVDVRIITPYIPDKKLVHMVTRSYYPQLINSGVRIYEYKPGFIHSKIFISDDISAILGTANLDFRSLYLHFECGTRLYGCNAVFDMKNDFLQTIEMCVEITEEFSKKQNIVYKIAQNIMRICAPLM